MRSLFTNPSVILAIIVMSSGGLLSADDSSGPTHSEESPLVERATTLDEHELTESSGLAFSRRKSNRVWTHNDSGGKPRLYAFDTTGRKTGQTELAAKMVDWEDIASYSDSGVPRLLVADSGDNKAVRPSITLYLFDEPNPDADTMVDRVQTIQVTYPNGPSDCEALAVDTKHQTIVMIAKTIFAPATVYTIPLPPRVSEPDVAEPDNGSSLESTITAKQVKRLALPLVTGMDIDAKTGTLWVTSYFQAFQFPSDQAGRSLAQLFDQQPNLQVLPRWKQIEAIGIDSESRVWVTSEGKPARIGRLPMIKPDKAVSGH